MELTAEEMKVAHRGGQLIKILHLINLPGMDDVAVKLNCGLTYSEQMAAERWFFAFKLAGADTASLFEMAADLLKATGDR